MQDGMIVVKHGETSEYHHLVMVKQLVKVGEMELEWVHVNGGELELETEDGKQKWKRKQQE
jgi:hypothetical protein